MHSLHIVPRPGVAIIGGESLLGKEVRELLDDSDLRVDVKLVASEQSAEEGSLLTRGRDEALVVTPLEAADLATARIVVLAGSPETSRRAYEQIRNLAPVPAVVDLSGGLEELPDARLRAPAVEQPSYQAEPGIQVIAHPAAIALTMFLAQLQKSGSIRRIIAEVFEPVSERGQAGIDELQKQTVNLLSFKPLSKQIFDAQVSFNMLSQFGSDSPHSLEAIELKIDRHLATLLAVAGAGPMPSLRLIQAPVFHGYSMSIWVEFDKNPGVPAIARCLASEKIDVRTGDEEPPTNVGVAGQGGIIVGGMTVDRNEPLACWFWLVADNFRVAAENALEVIRGFLR